MTPNSIRWHPYVTSVQKDPDLMLFRTQHLQAKEKGVKSVVDVIYG